MFTDLRVPLLYRPWPYHAVTCSSDHLLVAVSEPSPAGIAIHNWTGQQSQVITNQQMGLGGYIPAVCYSQMSRTLHVAAGDVAGVRSLRSYQVSERAASVDTRRYSHRLRQLPRFALYLASY